MEAGYAKAEVRNQAAREALVPLAEGERPPVVTVAAILAALVAISIVVTFAAGVKVNGSTPKVATVAAPALIMGVLAWGMWRARYWAVVCFQVVLVFLIFSAVYGLLVIATSVGRVRRDARAARRLRHALLADGEGDGADPDAGADAAAVAPGRFRPAERQSGHPRSGGLDTSQAVAHPVLL